MAGKGEKRIAEGLAGARAAADETCGGILPEGCPVRPLGHKSGTYWFADPEGQIREYRRLGEAEQNSLFLGQTQWLKDNYAEGKGNKGWNATEAASRLIHAAVRTGWYDPDAVRGPGAWWEGDGWTDGVPGPVILHHGDMVQRAVWRDDALVLERPVRAGCRFGAYVYPARPPEDRPADKPASVAEVRRFEHFLSSWNHARGKIGARLFLGAIALSFLPALLKFRPIVFIQAGSGTGKSALLTTAELTNRLSLRLETQSGPGLRDIFDEDKGARLLILNEVEAKAVNDRADGVTEFIRYNFTAGEGRTALFGRRSSPTHLLTILGGILPPPVDEMDANRRVVLRLLPLSATAEEKMDFDDRQVRAVEVGPALYRRMLWNLARWQQTHRAYALALMKKGFDKRAIDTWASLLAGWDLARFDELDERRPKRWARLLAPMAREKPLSIPETCLVHLMTYRVDEWAGGGKRTVGEHLAAALRKDPGYCRDDELRPIKRFGVTVTTLAGVDYIAVAKDHGGLETIFRGTHFTGGGWVTALKELDGAEDSPYAIRFGDGSVKLKGSGGERSRAVLLPTTYLDVEQQPAPATTMAGGVHGSLGDDV